jgi:hypothetical protein
MNRREALAALVGMPALTRLSSVGAIASGDVIVAELDNHISSDDVRDLKNHLQMIWPNNQVLICGPNVRLKVLPK